jgi:4-hydroxybenzoate polyprenyltransferase
MFLFQCSIGALNDIADAAADATVKPGKPIPAGRVPVPVAVIVAGACLLGGLGLAVSVSTTALAIGIAGVALGYAYDLGLKGTPFGWAPFALGIPLLPLFAWVGATGTAPAAIVVLSVLAVPAGAAVAVANALPDLERDEASGVRTVATALGPERAWRVDAALQSVVAGLALLTLLLVGGERPDIRAVAIIGWSIVGLGAGVILSGRPEVSDRQRGWEVQAVALGALGAGWVAAMVAAGRL